MESSLQEFLNEDQHRQLSETIREIISKLGDLPVNVAFIYKQCYSAHIDFMKEIDPERTLLLHKLTTINENSLYNQFQVIGATIIQLVTKNSEIYEKERSLKFLTEQVSREVNEKCHSDQFSLRIELNNSSNQGSNLWQCMHDELIQIAMGILGFMHKHYGMSISEERKMIEIEVFLEIFRQKFAGREKLSKIYMLSQRIEEKMQQSKNQSILLGEVQNDQWDHLLKQIDDIEKKEEEEEMQMARLHQLEEDFNQEQKPLEKKQSIFNSLKQKAQKTFHSVKAIITNSPTYEQKQITDIEIQESLETFIENLDSFQLISQPQRKAIEEISKMSLKQLEEVLQEEFYDKELGIIRYAIKNPIEKWDEYQKQIGEENELCNISTCILLNFSDQLEVATSRLKPKNYGYLNQEASYLLTAYFYRCLESNYSAFAKKYLSKVLRIIEKQMDRSSNNLRGSLRFQQRSSINPTKLANFLHQQRPLRSSNFELSNKSVIYQENNQFVPSEKVKQQTDQLLKDIKSQKGFHEVTPFMDIFRLNSCGQSKTVTICISGFLSQKSAKDLQWMGLIRALEETQLYSIGWQSSTLKESGTYLAKIATDLVLNPVNLSGPVGILGNVLSIGAKVIHQYKSNPFAAAHNRAAVVGLYLAQILIKVFPDRFINLVGFSLGTQVISCCLAHLVNQGKLYLINKVVLLGGAASQESIKQILEKSPVSIELINLWSSKDYAIRFIYRLCRFGLMPIGASNIRPISGHEIFNIDSSKFVGSHMEFRGNLYGIGLLTGLVHD